MIGIVRRTVLCWAVLMLVTMTFLSSFAGVGPNLENGNQPESGSEGGGDTNPTPSVQGEKTIRLGADNPEHDANAMGYSYQSGSYYYCYAYYYTYMYKSSSIDRRGYAVFDLADLTEWSGATVKSVKLLIHNYNRRYIKKVGFTALDTTPYYNPGTAIAKAVWEESGPDGTQIGEFVATSTTDTTYHTIEVDLDSAAATEMNDLLSSSPTYYTFGIGMWVKELHQGYSYGYLYWRDVRLEVTFEYDSELSLTPNGIAFGDDWSGHAYKYQTNPASIRPYGYMYTRKYSSYEYRSYAQWDVDSIEQALPAGDVTITAVSLRLNHRYSSMSDLYVYEMDEDVKTANADDVFTDCADGTEYAGPESVSSSFNEYEWDLGADAVQDLQEALDSRDYFGIGMVTTSTSGYSYDFSPRLVLKWVSEGMGVIRLGADNPEHDANAMGYSRQSGSYYYCYAYYYTYMYKSGSTDYHGFTVFDLADLGEWSGVTVKSAKLLIHNYYRYYVKTVNFTALDTTPYNSPGTAIAKAVYEESGPDGTQIGEFVATSTTDTTYHTIEVSLNAAAVTAINDTLSGSPTYYTFGIGFWVKELHQGHSYGYLRWTDIRLEVAFEYDSELELTPNGIAFGDDWSGHAYKYQTNPASIRPYGYMYTRKYSSYEYRSYAQWDMNAIAQAFPTEGSTVITSVVLRFNHRYSSMSNLHVYEMDNDVKTANADDVFTDCADGTEYAGPEAVSSSFNEYEWDLGADAVQDLQIALGTRDYFGIGMISTSTSGYSYDFSPRLVLKWISVNNTAPVADAGGPYAVQEGSVLTLDGSGSYDAEGNPLQYRWDFDGDSIWDTPWASSPTATHTWGDDYTVDVLLEVTDGSLSDTDSATVVVSNVAPTIEPFGPYTIGEGSSITLTATARDPGSDDLEFTWELELGPTIQNMYYNDGVGPDPYPSPGGTYPCLATDSLSHTYGDNAVYTVKLTVKDDDGGSYTYSTEVTVNNVAPSGGIAGSYMGDEGFSISFTAQATDPGSDDLTFKWDWGDGTADTVNTHYNDGVGPDPYPSPGGTFPFSATDSVTHVFGDNAVYTVTVTITDDDGLSTTVTTAVTVNNVAPSITPLGACVVDEGSPVTLTATATDPGSDDLLFDWDFELGPWLSNMYFNDGVGPDPYPSPGGTFPFTATDSVTHTYGDDGVYTVKLTVSDDDGLSTTVTTTVTVNNVAPTLSMEAYLYIDFTLRVSGEKWHDVQLLIYEDDVEVATTGVLRTPGSPDDQSITLMDVKCHVTKKVVARALYTPLDDPINGQPNGADPSWITIAFEDGVEIVLDTTFNWNHPETWDWITNVNQFMSGHEITFEAKAKDPGSDDLAFSWTWGDGTPDEGALYYCDGLGPDPPKSPWGVWPFGALDRRTHAYAAADDYNLHLSVQDDDGGLTEMLVTVILS